MFAIILIGDNYMYNLCNIYKHSDYHKFQITPFLQRNISLFAQYMEKISLAYVMKKINDQFNYQQQQKLINSKMSSPLNQTKPNPHSQLIHNFQVDRQQLHKIKQQNKILVNLHDKVVRKDMEIEQLQKVVKKYKKYYDQYDRVAGMLGQKTKQCQKTERQNKLLMQEIDKVLQENKSMQESLLLAEKNKHEYVKQRNGTDKRLRDIQDTFREYQDQCRNKEKQLLNDLQKAYRQIKQMSEKCQDLQAVKFENQQLKTKINTSAQRKNQNEGIDQNSLIDFDFYNSKSAQLPSNSPNGFHSQQVPSSNLPGNTNKSRQKSPDRNAPSHQLFIINGINLQTLSQIQQIQLLKKQLNAKQMELQRSKNLNHQLSIQFDKSVNKICEFQKQLSLYRRQNHELKRTLSLLVQKQQYQKMHKQKLKSVNNRRQQSQSSDMNDEQEETVNEQEEESWTGDEGYLRTSGNMSKNQRYHISHNSYGRSSERV